MVDNKTIARHFALLGKLMEIHEENPFKYNAYNNAHNILRNFEDPLADMSESQLSEIPGIGKAIASKIKEIVSTGSLSLLDKFMTITPEGVVELLNIRGLGPKKVRQLWKELQITSPGELLYACEENRLLELKGFGRKSQDSIRELVDFYLKNKGQFLFSAVEAPANQLVTYLKTKYPYDLISITGDIRRLMPVVSSIDVLMTTNPKLENIDGVMQDNFGNWIWQGAKLNILTCAKKDFYKRLFLSSGSEQFLETTADWDLDNCNDEETIFIKNNAAYIYPEYRESSKSVEEARTNSLPDLIKVTDIKGIVHIHSNYSDGLHPLSEMARYTQSEGFEYLVISDHSKSAYYANGLQEDRVEIQWREIEELNKTLEPFKIFKGIECDILNDGSLDYSDDFLMGFDVVIASIHSNLKMEKTHAMERLLKAVRHPSVHILGHPTGRLLLARAGYDIDHKLLIDECARYKVAIELNANPQRLDLDWTWIPYALERGVYIAINPDAHSKNAIHHIKYGINVARKAGLTAENCLNCLDKNQFQKWIIEKKNISI